MPGDGVHEALRKRLDNGRVVLVGLGNILRGDDGFGPELIASLSGSDCHASLIDAGTVPESYVGTIARKEPDTVVLADAAELGGEPGSVELLNRSDVAEGACLFSTHTMSPALVMELIEAETGAEVLLLAVQPLRTGFGDGMSSPVRDALVALSELFLSQKDRGSDSTE